MLWPLRLCVDNDVFLLFEEYRHCLILFTVASKSITLNIAYKTDKLAFYAVAVLDTCTTDCYLH